MKNRISNVLFSLSVLVCAIVPTRAADICEKDTLAGYLFVYFEGSGDPAMQEHLRFAISEDAVNWRALNNNMPVVNSDTLSSTGGIRDPHILRAEDGHTYLLVATDMNTARDGWIDPNPGIVMMKSDNLTEWSASVVNLSHDFPDDFADAYWVWAPQTIYDSETQKYLVYFSLRRAGDDQRLDTYGAFANPDFTGFESAPKLLFSTPNGCIDNDIVFSDGVYHMFFKGSCINAETKREESGIFQAVSASLAGPWTEVGTHVDPYGGNPAVEGSGIFKLNDGTGYVLMYDIFHNGRYEYLMSPDLYHFSDPHEFTKDFNPRHGTVLPLYHSEIMRLMEKWP